MTEKEVSEIRRRFRAEKSNITRIRGCYVNEKKEIISQFSQPISQLSQEETEEILAILKKTLSGTLSKNLIDIEFTTRQVMESEEHRLLMALRGSELNDEDAVEEFYHRIISSLSMEGNYLILLCSDKYDVPSYTKDGEKEGESSDVFTYILCSVCPVKQTKPLLSYYVYENRFRNLTPDWIVAAPQLGFLFPAFDDRSANIYNALYYTRDCAEIHEEFTDTVFRVPAPMPAAEQKETFQSILAETVSEDCSYDVVQAVHEQLNGLIEEHKANRKQSPWSFPKKPWPAFWNPAAYQNRIFPSLRKSMTTALAKEPKSVRAIWWRHTGCSSAHRTLPLRSIRTAATWWKHALSMASNTF